MALIIVNCNMAQQDFMDTPQSVESLFVFEAGSINTIIKDNHGKKT